MNYIYHNDTKNQANCATMSRLSRNPLAPPGFYDLARTLSPVMSELIYFSDVLRPYGSRQINSRLLNLRAGVRELVDLDEIGMLDATPEQVALILDREAA